MRDKNKVIKVFEKLENQRKLLIEKLECQHSELLKMPEGVGQWSVHQVLLHLIMAEEGALNYIKKKSQAPERIGERTVWTSFRLVLLRWMLSAPIKFKLPNALKPPSNEFEFQELIERYDTVRAETRKLIVHFPNDLLEGEIFRHPIAGRFSMYETLSFFDSHIKRHEKQIDRILRKLKERRK